MAAHSPTGPSQKKGLLFLNGEIGAAAITGLRPADFQLILAADGGFHHALQYGFFPDAVIGDFDSIRPEERQAHPGVQWIYRPDQNMNDLEKALVYALGEGVTHLIILGIGGGRLDHTLTNLSVIARFDTRLNLEFRQGEATIFPVRRQWTHSGLPGQLLSLAPLGEARGVRTRGLRFPLNGETLAPGQREGLSNVVEHPEITVTLESGLLLVFLFPPSREGSPQ